MIHTAYDELWPVVESRYIVTSNIEKKKWSLQALGARKRFSWKTCIAGCRCRMFDSICTSTYKVFQVPIVLMRMAVQKIVRKVMINWKTFVRQMQISCISLLTVRVMLESWKCPADIRTCLSKQVPMTKFDCRLYVARSGVLKLRRELFVTNESGHRRSK